ncbi:MAG: hypothetical protein A4E71_01758 [Smithella sp. PtaU1.Bin162]|nr:MAG: hypothetical protein A4E71_01758 [Smithella sp. PtaU1.Bin162]
MKKFLIFLSIIILLFSVNAIAAEKPITIKKMYIGMNVDDARNTVQQLLGKEWKITPTGDAKDVLADYRFGNELIFGKPGTAKPVLISEFGFAIYDLDNTYEGFIGCDKNTKQVTGISLGGILVDIIYDSKKVSAEDFVEQLSEHFNLPELSGMFMGWTFTSKNGYTLNIWTNKTLHIKKDLTKKNRQQINFE